ncbi:hypothetical protein BgiMline_013101 [Biomphalaria glabrata]|nr:hypothetical protein BgiMline_016915 [Biomphalaria glabrata]
MPIYHSTPDKTSQDPHAYLSLYPGQDQSGSSCLFITLSLDKTSQDPHAYLSLYPGKISQMKPMLLLLEEESKCFFKALKCTKNLQCALFAVRFMDGGGAGGWD